MNTFVSSLNKTAAPTVARTHNGALTHATSGSVLVDLFNLAGSSRGKDITNVFASALKDNAEIALRTALWARDVRGGAGERETFRSFLRYLEKNDAMSLMRVLPRVPDLGRWDDLLILETPEARQFAFAMIKSALESGNGLCAKWMPRKGKDAVELREFLGFTPKRYRKTLVSLTKVVETQMCAKNWNEINFSHVPSVAAKRYRKAFYKNAPEVYKAYVEELKKPVPEGEKAKVKINAGAIFPHDVILELTQAAFGYKEVSKADYDVIEAQWKALPDFVGEGSFIPLCDVSGSMTSSVGAAMLKSFATSARNIDVSVALGVYLSERNKGAFKDVVLHFASTPYIEVLKGDLRSRVNQFTKNVHMSSTDLQAAFRAILDHAVKNKVPSAEMPQKLLIISDMEFNQTCAGAGGRYGEITNFDAMRVQYAQAGYDIPDVIFWNLNGREGNSPVKSDTKGAAIVSGFSPSIMKSIMSSKKVTPLDMLMETVMNDRYKLADVA